MNEELVALRMVIFGQIREIENNLKITVMQLEETKRFLIEALKEQDREEEE